MISLITKHIRKIIIIVVVLLTSRLVNAQVIDDYGIRIGAGLSNQFWEYNNSMFSDLSGWKEKKIGFTGQVFVEKYFGRYFSVRPVIGYMPKGFIDDITLITAEEEKLAVKDNKVVLHNLSLDFSIKIIPIQKSVKPYILLGFRGDYLMGYKSVIINFQGENHELNTELYNDFNKFNLGGLMGIGISYNDLLFLDFEYNPAISKNFKSDGLVIRDKYFALIVGLNIHQLINNKNE